MKRTVYYPRIKSINFYDVDGVVCGGMMGDIARNKFYRMLKSGKWPRVSLRKHVIVALKGGAR